MPLRPLPVFDMFDRRGRNCGHLQPTVHLPPSLAPPISGRTYGLLRDMRILAVETVPTTVASSTIGVLLLDQICSWPQVLEPWEQSIVEAAAQKLGLEPSRLDRDLLPIGLALHLQRAAIHMVGDTLPVLDELLVESALQHGVAVTALEPLGTTATALRGLPLGLQREALMELCEVVLVDPDELLEQLQQLADLATRAAYHAAAPSLLDPLGLGRFAPQLVDSRNPAIAARIAEMVEWCCGRVIFAVGAAHLPGPDGLCALLAKHRISVERVRMSGRPVDLMDAWSDRLRHELGRDKPKSMGTRGGAR
jgi:uncharacterized protein YbaP (TraB family)